MIMIKLREARNHEKSSSGAERTVRNQGSMGELIKKKKKKKKKKIK